MHTSHGDAPLSIASSPKQSANHKWSNKASIPPKEVRQERTKINAQGRLGDSLVGVIRDLASRSVGNVDSTDERCFNNDFQEFADRVESKVQLRASFAHENADMDTNLDFSPKHIVEPAASVVVEPQETIGSKCSEAIAQQMDGKMNISNGQDAPLSTEHQTGYVLGASACISGKPHDATAKSLELCELLALSVEAFNAAVAKERLHRRRKRETHLLEAIPGLRALDRERMERVVECFRSSNHRRGAVLCWEGEVRVPHDDDDRLQVVMEGCVRMVKARTEVPQIDFRGRKEHIPLQKDVGTYFPGQIVNAHSQLLGSPEPFTAIADSAEVIILSATHSDLVRLGGSGLLDSLIVTAEEIIAVRDERLRRKLEAMQYEANPHLTHAKLTKWLVAGESVDPMGVPHAYLSKDMANMNACQTQGSFSRREVLRGGPKQLRKIMPLAEPSFAASAPQSLRPLVRRVRSAPSTADGSSSCRANRKNPKSVSVSDTIFLKTESWDIQHACPASTLLPGSGLLDDHFAFAPIASRCASHLLIGDASMRFPKVPRLERLEARGAQATTVAVTPTDPLHIAAIDLEPLEYRMADLRVSTAPAKLNLTVSSFGDNPMPLLAETAPLTRCLPKLQPDRRWKALEKKGECATPGQQEPDDMDRLSDARSSDPDPLGEGDTAEWHNRDPDGFVHSQDEFNCSTRVDLGRSLLQSEPSVPSDMSLNTLQGGPTLQTLASGDLFPGLATPHRRDRQPIENGIRRHPSIDRSISLSAAMELDLVTDKSAEPLVALEGFACGSEALESSLLESPDIFQEGSLSAGATLDPFAGTSLANLSTTLDESSVWDQMWSVIGSGPSDSIWMSSEGGMWMSQDSLAHGSKSCSLQPPRHPTASKKQDGPRGSGGGAHLRTRQWVAKLGYSERQAKRYLGESSPLHVNGIDRFLRKPEPPTQRRLSPKWVAR